MFRDLTQSDTCIVEKKKDALIPAGSSLTLYSLDTLNPPAAGVITAEYMVYDDSRWAVRAGRAQTVYTWIAPDGALPVASDYTTDIGDTSGVSVTATMSGGQVELRFDNTSGKDFYVTADVLRHELGDVQGPLPAIPQLEFTVVGLPLNMGKDNIVGLGNGVHVLDADQYVRHNFGDPTATYVFPDQTRTMTSGSKGEFWYRTKTQQFTADQPTSPGGTYYAQGMDRFKLKLTANGSGCGGGSNMGFTWSYQWAFSYTSGASTLSGSGTGGGTGGGGGGPSTGGPYPYGQLQDNNVLVYSKTLGTGGGTCTISWQRRPGLSPGAWANY